MQAFEQITVEHPETTNAILGKLECLARLTAHESENQPFEAVILVAGEGEAATDAVVPAGEGKAAAYADEGKAVTNPDEGQAATDAAPEEPRSPAGEGETATDVPTEDDLTAGDEKPEAAAVEEEEEEEEEDDDADPKFVDILLNECNSVLEDAKLEWDFHPYYYRSFAKVIKVCPQTRLKRGKEIERQYHEC